MNPSIAEFKRRRINKDLKTTTPNQVVKFSVYFHKKDTSYINDREPATGYYMSFQPETICKTDTPGVEIREMKAFTGCRMAIHAASRFDRKKLEQLAEIMPTTEQYRLALQQTLDHNQLVLSPVQ